MDTKAYERIFAPKSVAAVGASPAVDRFGGRILHSLETNGYGGAIYPVNPKYATIGALRCYPTICDIDGDVDLAILTVSTDYVLPTLRDCVAKNVGLAVLFGAGYAETGSEGELAQEELLAVTKGSSMRILGPNCVGFLNVPDCVPATPAGVVNPPKLRDGGISIVAQSGFVGMETIFGRGYDAGLGFRYVITTGNEADLEAAELIRWLAEDEKTRVIVAYLEGIRDAAKFREAAAVALEADKPIVLLKAGRSPEGERSARSHTAALAVSDSVLDAVCEADAVVRVTDLDDLWEVAGHLGGGLRIKGPRVAIVGTSGGINTILSDALHDAELLLPPLRESTVSKLATILPWYGSTANPVDLTGYFTGAGQYEVYPELCKLVASDPGIDVVVFAVQVDRPTPWDEVIPDLVDALRSADKPVIVLSGGASAAEQALDVLQRTGIPVYWSPARCARALKLISDHGVRSAVAMTGTQRGPRGSDDDIERTGDFAALDGSRSRWDAERALLTAYNIPTVATELAANEHEAQEIAERLGYPIVVKGLAPGLSHKSDLGLVYVGLNDAGEVADAFRNVEAQLHQDGAVVVQSMLQGGLELLAGIQNDPTFGPVVVVAGGGTLVELLEDRRLAMPPLSVERAMAMLASLRAAPLFSGFRGGARYDMAAAAKLLAALAELACDLGATVDGVDLNPVIVLPEGQGAVVVDWIVHTSQEQGLNLQRDSRSKETL